MQSQFLPGYAKHLPGYTEAQAYVAWVANALAAHKPLDHAVTSAGFTYAPGELDDAGRRVASQSLAYAGLHTLGA